MDIYTIAYFLDFFDHKKIVNLTGKFDKGMYQFFRKLFNVASIVKILLTQKVQY